MENQQNNSQNTQNRRVPVNLGKVGEFFKKMDNKKLCIILGVFTAIYLVCAIYFGLISFSIYNVGLRFTIVFFALVWSIPFIRMFFKESKVSDKKIAFKSVKYGWKIPMLIGAIILVLAICLALFTTPMFMAKNYRDMISLTTKADAMDFETEIEDEEQMLVAVIDKAFAKQLGDKRIGQGNYGSQFEINEMTLIYYNNNLYWVGALEPIGFFQWTSSVDGSPGYVMVDATNPQAEAVLVETKIKYTPGAYFNCDAQRQLYFGGMGLLRDVRLNFELDDEGNPYYTQSILRKSFGATSGDDVIGVMTLNAVTGDTEYYKVTDKDMPTWIDRVQSTEVLIKQLNYWGKYTHGYFNTWFAKEEVNSTTSGYNYVYNKGNLYLTTGITSIASDNAIVGMVLADLKTAEASFYKVNGATEQAAQGVAQGMFQAEGYKATFPTLVNFKGTPSFLMAMKDSNGTIQSYVFLSVSEYTTKKASGSTLEGARASYANVLGVNIGEEDPNPPTEEDIQEDTWNVEKVYGTELIDGNTHYIIKFANNEKVYKISAATTQNTYLLIGLQNNTNVTLKYSISSGKIIEIVSVGN